MHKPHGGAHETISDEVKAYCIEKSPEQAYGTHCQHGRGRASRVSSYQIPTDVPEKPKGTFA